jgi:hypothetical protein
VQYSLSYDLLFHCPVIAPVLPPLPYLGRGGTSSSLEASRSAVQSYATSASPPRPARSPLPPPCPTCPFPRAPPCPFSLALPDHSPLPSAPSFPFPPCPSLPRLPSPPCPSPHLVNLLAHLIYGVRYCAGQVLVMRKVECGKVEGVAVADARRQVLRDLDQHPLPITLSLHFVSF